MKFNPLHDKKTKMLFHPAGVLAGIFILLAVFVPETPSALAASDSARILFYSSETNINNFTSLKAEFDTYLSRFGPFEFQPFSSRKTFEEELKNTQNHILLLSHFHFNAIFRDYSLKPVLTGVRNGKNFQTRLLVSSKYSDIQQAVKGPVASSCDQDFTRNLLAAMINDQKTAAAARILTVPKDIDALMSVGFNMSKCALITENTLEIMKKTDPVMYKRMKNLAEGTKSLLLTVAVPEKFADKARKLLELIEKMPDHPDGENIIKMLDLDGWQAFNASDNS